MVLLGFVRDLDVMAGADLVTPSFLKNSVNCEHEALDAEVERHRDEFQQLSTQHMIDRIDALREAEPRRRKALPSTPPFHSATGRYAQAAAS